MASAKNMGEGGMVKMNKTLFQMLVLSLTISVTSPVLARNAKCLIKSGNVTQFRGTCDFRAAPDGSFSLTSARSPGRFIKNIEMVSVTLMSSGKADVRGLTTMGINSRWGSARRSRKDRACWIGSDFKICVW
jgi:hypothetical protein